MEVIAGIDEAGRGPLAGPVVAAAVILPKDHSIVGLNDSKKISSKKLGKLINKLRNNKIKQAKKNPDYIIGVHGIYLTHGILGQIARKRDININFWDGPWANNTIHLEKDYAPLHAFKKTIDKNQLGNFNSEKERRPSVYEFIKNEMITTCYASDDGSALHFKNGKLFKSISFCKDSKSYIVSKGVDGVITEKNISGININ